jgi:hypothetical protein
VRPKVLTRASPNSVPAVMFKTLGASANLGHAIFSTIHATTLPYNQHVQTAKFSLELPITLLRRIQGWYAALNSLIAIGKG